MTPLSTIDNLCAVRPEWASPQRPSVHAALNPSPTVLKVLVYAPVLLFSVIAHEYAHGYAALKQGDETALLLGRLTFNPLKHIDPVLTIIMPVILWSLFHFGLGGAKPVPVDPRNYRNPKRGDIIVSLAGVTANLALALICTLLVVPLGLIVRFAGGLTDSLGILQAMMLDGVWLNLALIVFNLLPIPPLDGSHVMKYLLPPKIAYQYARLSFAGLFVIIILLRVYPRALDVWFTPAEWSADHLMNAVSQFVIPGASAWQL